MHSILKTTCKCPTNAMSQIKISDFLSVKNAFWGEFQTLSWWYHLGNGSWIGNKAAIAGGYGNEEFDIFWFYFPFINNIWHLIMLQSRTWGIWYNGGISFEIFIDIRVFFHWGLTSSDTFQCGPRSAQEINLGEDTCSLAHQAYFTFEKV